MADYFSIVLLALFAIGFAALFVLLSSVLGPRNPRPIKSSTYESGHPVPGRFLGRFSVKFYIVAVLFLLFDLEVVFLYPWAIQQKQLGLFGLVEILIFTVILLVGWYYVIKQGVLEWGTPAGPDSHGGEKKGQPQE